MLATIKNAVNFKSISDIVRGENHFAHMRLGVLSIGERLYSTQRIVKEAKRRGHDVRIVDYTRCALFFDKTTPKVIYHGEDISEFADAIIPRIGASYTKQGLLVVNQFEKRDIYNIASSIGILRSRNKLLTFQHLVEHNVPIPKTVYGNNKHQLKEQLALLDSEKVIIKFLEGTHGLGVMLAESKQSAISIIETMSALNQMVLLQEFVEEANGADIRAYVVGEKVVASMRRKSNGDFRSNVHRGGSTQAIKLTTEEEDIAVTSAQCLGLDVAGVDILRSNRGSLVIEVNSSAGLEGIEGATKVNIAGEIIRYIEQRVNDR